MEWYHIALIAVVVIVLAALFVRSRSGRQEEQPQAAAPAQQAGEDRQAPEQMDAAVLAVIAAAVLAMAGPAQRLVVRDIRRAASTESLWAQEGRRDLMNR